MVTLEDQNIFKTNDNSKKDKKTRRRVKTIKTETIGDLAHLFNSHRTLAPSESQNQIRGTNPSPRYL